MSTAKVDEPSAEENNEFGAEEDNELSEEEDYEIGAEEDDETGAEEDNQLGAKDEVICKCGLPAMLRVSRTSKNLYRLFYNCSKWPFHSPCKFFKWSDDPLRTGDKHLDELTLIRRECIRLGKRVCNLQQKCNSLRTAWNKERTELTSQLCRIKAELDEVRKRVKIPDESDPTPPPVKKVKHE